MEDVIKLAAEIKSWVSLQTHTDTGAASVFLPVRHWAGGREREEALKLKLLLQLCICCESLAWVTLTAFTLASLPMEWLWQQKKQVVLSITCCSRQLRQDIFLRAQMKPGRLYWALLLFSEGKNACYLLEKDIKREFRACEGWVSFCCLFSEDADLWSRVTAKLCLDCLQCHMENHVVNGQCMS